MKGVDDGASFAANTQMIQDYKSFYNLGEFNRDWSNPQGCYFDSGISYCFGGGFYQVNTDSHGFVRVHGSSSEGCNVDSDGYSHCSE